MGYIQQSDIKKIYAYLTQLGKEKIISGDTTDFQIKYFSLHDDDINYIVASQRSGTTYNIPKSGFVPNITGDNNLCLPNISDATFLKTNILFDITSATETVVLEPTYKITPDKNIIYENDTITFTIDTQNVDNGTVLNWTNIGTSIASDFVENTINGSVTIMSNKATFSLKAKYDTITETNGESIIIVLKNQTGNILATAPQVIVNDLPPLQGGVMTPCLNNGTSKIRISIFLPSGGGGAGGPYKWKAVPIDSNGNLVFPYDPNIYITRSITETYDFLTEYNNSNVFYNIYLIDSQGNEGLINTTTTTCSIAPTGSLILTVEPTNITVATVGSYDLIGTNIVQEPSQNFNFIATLTKSDGSAITLSEQNSVSFKLTKDLNSDNYIDISGQFGPFSDSTVYSFANNVISTGGNSFIQKRINLKVVRNNNVLNKPASNSFAITSGFSIKLKLNTVTGGPTVQNETLTINGNKWIWI